MKAWFTTCLDIESLVFADTRSQARLATLDSARDAGYRVKWIDCNRVVCAPEFDHKEGAADWIRVRAPHDIDLVARAAGIERRRGC